MKFEPGTIVVENEALRRGFTIIPNYILRNPALGMGTRLLYAILLSYAWQEGSCFPGQDRLATDLGVSERMVRNYLAELRKTGFIDVVRRGLGLTNIYVIKDVSSPERKPESGLDRKLVSAQERKLASAYKDSGEKDSDEKDSISPESGGAAHAEKTEKPTIPEEIQFYRAVIRRYPRKPLWGRVIEVIRARRDAKLLRRCFEECVARGYGTEALDIWFFEWYAQGRIPKRRGRGEDLGTPADPLSYEELRAQYVPEGYEDIIVA